jgi:hypothetical protein
VIVYIHDVPLELSYGHTILLEHIDCGINDKLERAFEEHEHIILVKCVFAGRSVK